MKDNVVYNNADNMVTVKTNGDEINVICNTEKQIDEVVKKLQYKLGNLFHAKI